MHKKLPKLKNFAFITLVIVAAVTFLGSKSDANEKNFSNAINSYYKKKGDLCLTNSWPIDLHNNANTDIVIALTALEGADFAKSEDAEVDALTVFDRPQKEIVTRYTLTDVAKPYMQERLPSPWSANVNKSEKEIALCWGKRVLDKIVKWEGPMKLGEYQEVAVFSTYKVENLADWAKAPEMQTAIPAIKTVINGSGKTVIRLVLKLTSEGWEVKSLN